MDTEPPPAQPVPSIYPKRLRWWIAGLCVVAALAFIVIALLIR